MRLKVYLDTSVFNALLDSRVAERQRETKEFWDRLASFAVATSDTCRQEMQQTLDDALRERLLGLLADVRVFKVTEEMEQLAQRYVAETIFKESMINDALHVACAVLGGQDVLVSWNFRHLVNRSRRSRIAEVNTTLGLPIVEIVAPPEI